ncbi:MAG: exonuclease SbcCD subunit D [Ancrocorticia sp.]
MRILHTSDWHLGRSLHGADLMPAFELWCEHVIGLVRERGIDAVLISGDVYDRGVPSTQVVELFNRTLTELSELTTVILTSGNHDSPLRLGFGAGLMKDSIHIRTEAQRAGEPVEVRSRSGELGALVYPIPYLDPDIERRNLAPRGDDGEGPRPEDYLERSHEAVLRAALDLVAADIAGSAYAGSDVARICMVHAFVTGGEASPSERDIHVGGVDNAPSGLFRLEAVGGPELSYVALGHLHSPQKIGVDGDPLMRYSGSPIAFSFSETRAKSSVLLEIDGARVEAELIPAPVWRPVVTLTGTMEELLSPRSSIHAESFARLIVTDSARPADMSAKLRRAFPHALEIQHQTEAIAREPRLAQITAMNPVDVLTDFMKISGNKELDEEEKSLVTAVWEQVRAEYEEEAK